MGFLVGAWHTTTTSLVRIQLGTFVACDTFSISPCFLSVFYCQTIKIKAQNAKKEFFWPNVLLLNSTHWKYSHMTAHSLRNTGNAVQGKEVWAKVKSHWEKKLELPDAQTTCSRDVNIFFPSSLMQRYGTGCFLLRNTGTKVRFCQIFALNGSNV